MSFIASLPENAIKRLSKVIIRTIHLVGVAGTFGNAMMNVSSSIYITIAIISGIVLTIMEAYGSPIWFVQLRGISVYIKLFILGIMHIFPQTLIPSLIAVIVISGFMSHAPSWIRYYSLQHRKVVHSYNDLLG